MSNLQITNLDAAFLRRLLEAVESGSVIVTEFTFSRDVESVEHTADGVEAPSTTVNLGDETYWSITTRPADRAVEAFSQPSSYLKASNPYEAYTWEHMANLVPALIRALKTRVLSEDEFEQKATWARQTINTILSGPRWKKEVYEVLTSALGDLHRELDAIGRPGL